MLHLTEFAFPGGSAFSLSPCPQPHSFFSLVVVDGDWSIDVTGCDGNQSSFEMVVDSGEVIILVWNK